MEDLLKQTAKGSAIVFAGIFAGSVMRYGAYILFARLLGPGDYGLISLGLALIGILGMLSLFGLTKGVPRSIAFHKNKNITRGIIKTSIKYSLSISISIAVLLLLFSTQISQYFNTSFMEVLPFFAIALPLYVFVELSASVFGGIKKFNYKVYVREILLSSVLLVVFSILYLSGMGIYSALFAIVLSYLIPAIISYILIQKEINLFGKTEYISKELLKLSVPLLLASFFFLIIRWSDVIILGIFRTSDYVGIYNTALPTSMALTVVITAVGFVFLPIASELFSKRKINDLNSLYSTTTRWLFIAAFPMFLIMLLFPSQIIRIIFGDAYVAAGMSLAILSIGSMVNIATGLVGILLIVMNEPKLVVISGSFAAVLNIILNLTLIPIYGMIGAAVSTTICMSAVNILMLYFVRKRLKNPYNTQYLKHIFAALIPAFLVYLISRTFFEVIPLYIKIIGFVAYILLYALLTIILKGITKEDIIILKSIENKTGFKIKFLRNFVKKFI